MEQCIQACLAQAGAPKDVKSYSDQSFTKKLRRFFNKPQLNIQANATKKSVVWEIESTPLKHATGLAKTSTPYGYMEMSEACNFIKKEALAQVFSCEFWEISKNTFFTEHLWATASNEVNGSRAYCLLRSPEN